MKNRSLYWCLMAVLFCLIIGMSLRSQTTTATTPASAVQVNPAGSPLTSQTFWIQTSTGAAAANNVTQPAVSGKTNYLTGFEITGDGSTAGTPITVTLTSGGTTIANYSVTPGAIATLAQVSVICEFPHPVVGLGPGQNMVLNVPSFGAGNTAASVTMHGYSQ